MVFRTLKDIDVKHRKVLVRVDFNVPVDEKGNITDDSRIQAAIPTINYLRKQKAITILITHFGRPEGVQDVYRTDILAKRLSYLMQAPVYKFDDVIGADVEENINQLALGEVCLLENLRFYPEEEQNSEHFAIALSELAQVYVNDAFSVSHRNHASIVGVPQYLPSAAGLLLQKEMETIDKALHNPKHPFIAVLGGVKVSDKIEVIKHLLPKADAILIGGAMAFTFLKATKKEIGKSKVEPDKVAFAKSLLHTKKILLPVDCVIATNPDGKASVVSIDDIPKNQMGLDIGPKTANIFASLLTKAKTVIWNGPMGLFEKKAFAKGTEIVAKAIESSKAISIVGGGDTADAIKNYKFTHVSTGGGASLEVFAGKPLPGIEALERNYVKFKRP